MDVQKKEFILPYRVTQQIFLVSKTRIRATHDQMIIIIVNAQE